MRQVVAGMKPSNRSGPRTRWPHGTSPILELGVAVHRRSPAGRTIPIMLYLFDNSRQRKRISISALALLSTAILILIAPSDSLALHAKKAKSAKDKIGLMTVEPSDPTVKVGDTVTFTVNVPKRRHKGPHYRVQWYQDQYMITGETGHTLVLHDVSFQDAGSYFAVMTKRRARTHYVPIRYEEAIEELLNGGDHSTIPKRRGIPVVSTIATLEVRPIRVLLLGNSITRGRVRPAYSGRAFAEVLPELLGEDYEVVNIGVGGASSLDWTLTTPSYLTPGGWIPEGLFEYFAVPELPADIVVILLGTNDATGYFEPEPVPPREYRSAIEEIIANLFDQGAGDIILLTPPQIANWGALVRLAAYGDYIIDICSDTENVHLGADLFDLLSLSLHFNDNVHPNGEGHEEIAYALYEAILDLY